MGIRVLVNGATGRMGKETVIAINKQNGLELVGELNSQDNLSDSIKSSDAQVVVDFTTPTAVYENMKTIIESGARPVVGTTGLQQDQIAELTKICASKKLGGIIAPNFSIGAVLMMTLSQEAAKYLPHVEIIELHHDKKLDSPSGTAIKTAEMIAQTRKEIPSKVSEKKTMPGARGADVQNIPIHSVRLPGLVAHQQVIFGDTGETLTIKHDTVHREAFMPGVCLACQKVTELNTLVYGLEKIL